MQSSLSFKGKNLEKSSTTSQKKPQQKSPQIKELVNDNTEVDLIYLFSTAASNIFAANLALKVISNGNSRSSALLG